MIFDLSRETLAIVIPYVVFKVKNKKRCDFAKRLQKYTA
ncbi:hypothetical protein HMPREF1050_0897 [Haemophilus parahaemolyticus HK385]|uniref:Uncharacterized protein n=1 Tax=Haemophilus parahaemolyticus HK385 TaxID=1095744 RepID=A0ABN0EYN2_HAEPH|nr:hypothetical protein HMPREF1050_0897 [Haemophilus parahaemolyticus HK385]